MINSFAPKERPKVSFSHNLPEFRRLSISSVPVAPTRIGLGDRLDFVPKANLLTSPIRRPTTMTSPTPASIRPQIFGLDLRSLPVGRLSAGTRLSQVGCLTGRCSRASYRSVRLSTASDELPQVLGQRLAVSHPAVLRELEDKSDPQNRTIRHLDEGEIVYLLELGAPGSNRMKVQVQTSGENCIGWVSWVSADNERLFEVYAQNV